MLNDQTAEYIGKFSQPLLLAPVPYYLYYLFSGAAQHKNKVSMLIMTSNGLFCPAGDFYIDPRGAVDHAIITHAHSDHARRGSKQYYCASPGTGLLKARLGKNIAVSPFPYGEKFLLHDVVVSFHPAGHILGSAQIRLEQYGQVWVVSGDYKLDPDPTCEPLETVKCDVFITEATFGTPAYAWNKTADFGQQIFNWWQQNKTNGFNSVIYAYSLGKVQRILGLLRDLTNQPVYCHPAAEKLNVCYRNEGINLTPTVCLSTIADTEILHGELLLVPPAFFKTGQQKILGNRFKTAFASGWMAKSHYRFDNGFVLSDHADWNDLLDTITRSHAQRVYVQHRGNGALVRELKARKIKAFPDTALLPKNPDQLLLF